MLLDLMTVLRAIKNLLHLAGALEDLEMDAAVTSVSQAASNTQSSSVLSILGRAIQESGCVAKMVAEVLAAVPATAQLSRTVSEALERIRRALAGSGRWK